MLEVKSLSNLTGNPVDQPIALRFRGLQKAFGGQTVLDKVTAALHPGEVVLLQGANGSGKTTLLNALTGNLAPDAGEIELFTNGKSEDFRFPSQWWQSLNPLTRFAPEQLASLGVSRTWQDIRLFPTLTLLDNITVATPKQLGENPIWALLRRPEILKQEGNNRRDAQTKLAQLGLGGREKSSADQVSLGQSKRVAIARAVQAGAKILFLDEPLAGLDAPGIAEVMQLLESLALQERVTLVIVEHIFNIPRILELATTVWTLADGKLTVESVAKVKNLDAGDRILPSQPESIIPAWLKDIAGEGGKINHLNLPGGAVLSLVMANGLTPGAIMLEVEDLVVYRGKRLVIGDRAEDGQVQGLSFSLHQGELALLQAPNGWGKTSLLEAIAGLIPMDRGIIRLIGRPIHKLPTWERIGLGLSFLQSRDNVFASLTVTEALRLYKVRSPSESLKPLLKHKISDLSGGQKQKLALSGLQTKRTAIQMLDEPFSALDLSSLQIPFNILKPSAEKTYLIAIPSTIQAISL